MLGRACWLVCYCSVILCKSVGFRFRSFYIDHYTFRPFFSSAVDDPLSVPATTVSSAVDDPLSVVAPSVSSTDTIPVDSSVQDFPGAICLPGAIAWVVCDRIVPFLVISDLSNF